MIPGVARLVVLALVLASPSFAQDGPVPASAALAGQIAAARPNPEAGPTRVSIGLYVIDISKIDAVEQSMTADFAVRLTWQDPRLASPEAQTRELPMNSVWSPRVTVVNKRRIWKTWPDTVRVDSAGNVQYNQRFYGTLTARLDLHDFPFDNNTIRIELISAGHSTDEVELVLDEAVTGRTPEFSLVDASIGAGEVTTGDFYFAPADINMPKLTYEFDVHRYTAYYLWKIILPLTIIVFMSWLVFWIDPAQFGPQIGLAATAVLTLIAYRFLLGSLIPRVSYLTRLDIFIMGATVLVFLGMVEAVASARIAQTDEKRARLVDRLSRVVFPCAFLVVGYLAFFA